MVLNSRLSLNLYVQPDSGRRGPAALTTLVVAELKADPRLPIFQTTLLSATHHPCT